MDGYDMKHVYVILSESGLVKIGVSDKPDERIKALENASGFGVIDRLIFPKCANSYAVESAIHSHFKSRRKKGEWFDIGFTEAVAVASEIYKDFSSDVRKEKPHVDTKEFAQELYSKALGEKFSNVFSDDFMEMAIELGEKMKEIKRLQSIVDSQLKVIHGETYERN